MIVWSIRQRRLFKLVSMARSGFFFAGLFDCCTVAVEAGCDEHGASLVFVS